MGNKIWKRNAVVATVLLFVCVGIYLNWSHNQDQGVPTLTDTLDTAKLESDDTLAVDDGTVNADADADADANVNGVSVETASEDLAQAGDTDASDYFAQVRLSRQQSRDNAVEELQQTMSYEAGEDENAVSSASETLDGLVEDALEEAQIESMVIAKGYTDCVAFMNDDGISVAVAAPEEGLQATDIALVSDIVTGQTDYTLDNIRIIEVK